MLEKLITGLSKTTDQQQFNTGWRLPQNEQDKVRKAMEFKKSLGEELPGNDDDILVIYSNNLVTRYNRLFIHWYYHR